MSKQHAMRWIIIISIVLFAVFAIGYSVGISEYKSHCELLGYNNQRWLECEVEGTTE